MKHIPSLIGVLAMFCICYVLSYVDLSGIQVVMGIIAVVLVYGATMAWHIRNIL
jgi:hypothetical protein